MSVLSQFFAGGGMKQQMFIANGTWTCPAPNTKVFVICIGGGGEGGQFVGTPAAGGSSSFGSLVTATGGARGGGPTGQYGGAGGAGYNNGQRGQTSVVTYQMGQGGRGAPGLFNIGNGGEGESSTNSNGGAAGGGGSGNVSVYSGVVSTDQVIVVGQGGSALSAPYKGYGGAVIVYWE